MAAQNGTLTLVGLETGRTYNIDVYLPDAVATNWTFSAVGPALSTSSNFYILPEMVQVYDFVLATAPTATNATLYTDNAPVLGGVLRYANQLSSNPNRQRQNIRLAKGSQLQGLQA